MDGLRRKGVESLAIPHNSNISGGAAFKMTYYDGKLIDEAYASQRIRNEPLVEVTQAKGSSETHPLLSKNDEWAAFEIPVEKQACFSTGISNAAHSSFFDSRGCVSEEPFA